MAVKNITSNIKTSKTLSEISEILVRFGATKIMIDYTGEYPTGLMFQKD